MEGLSYKEALSQYVNRGDKNLRVFRVGWREDQRLYDSVENGKYFVQIESRDDHREPTEKDKAAHDWRVDTAIPSVSLSE